MVYRVPKSTSFIGLRWLFISFLLISILDGVSLVIKNMVIDQDIGEIEMGADAESNDSPTAQQPPEKINQLLDFLFIIRAVHWLNLVLILIEVAVGVTTITSIPRFGSTIVWLHFGYMTVFFGVMVVTRITVESFDLRGYQNAGNIFIFLAPPTSYELMSYVKLISMCITFLIAHEVRKFNKSRSGTSNIALT